MKKLFSIIMGLILPGVALAMCSCAGVVSGLTGQPVASTEVQREGGKPVKVATSDLLQAEAGPAETVYGMYDVGVVAGQIGRVTGKEAPKAAVVKDPPKVELTSSK